MAGYFPFDLLWVFGLDVHNHFQNTFNKSLLLQKSEALLLMHVHQNFAVINCIYILPEPVAFCFTVEDII